MWLTLLDRGELNPRVNCWDRQPSDAGSSHRMHSLARNGVHIGASPYRNRSSIDLG